MLSLYEILKASKTGIAPDMWTALAGKNWGGVGSGAETKELTGIPPLSFRANGQPLIDYLISGNMSQTGTPTPTTPIQPQETGDRTGNLFDYTSLTMQQGAYIDDNGDIVTTGATAGVAIIYWSWVPISELTEYCMSCATSRPWTRVYFYDSNKNFLSRSSPNNTVDVAKSFTTPANCAYVNFQEWTGSNPSNELNTVMLNAGSEPLPYEPYGYKIPILNNSQTTNVYLGEVQTTRRIRKLVLDGTENWTYRSGDPTNVFFMYLPTAKTGEVAMSNAYPYYSGTDFVDMNDKEFAIIRSNLAIRNSNYQYESQFKAYLAQQYANGTPVTVWYVLATPTTGILNEPLRKIGDYADTLSYEQAGVQIPTNRGNTVIDVLTELKPSQMYIKYQE